MVNLFEFSPFLSYPSFSPPVSHIPNLFIIPSPSNPSISSHFPSHSFLSPTFHLTHPITSSFSLFPLTLPNVIYFYIPTCSHPPVSPTFPLHIRSPSLSPLLPVIPQTNLFLQPFLSSSILIFSFPLRIPHYPLFLPYSLSYHQLYICTYIVMLTIFCPAYLTE